MYNDDGSKHVDRAYAAGRAAERERCAKIAEEWKSPLKPGTEARLLGHEEAAREIAQAIRRVDGQ
jgi:hypothetical protein